MEGIILGILGMNLVKNFNICQISMALYLWDYVQMLSKMINSEFICTRARISGLEKHEIR